MATPKLNKTTTDQLHHLLVDFQYELAIGGYTDRVQQARTDHARDFVLFLEGKFSPATEKGKQRHI